MTTQMWLICFSLVAAERQQCHTTHLRMFKGFFSTRSFFNSAHLYLSRFLLLQSFARSSQHLSSWQEIQKWADLNEVFACYLPACSPHHTPAWLAPESRKHPEVPCHFTCSHVPGAWQLTSNKIKLSLISVPDNLHGKRHLCVTFLDSIRHLQIHRYLYLLLLSKLWVAGNPRDKFKLIQ